MIMGFFQAATFALLLFFLGASSVDARADEVFEYAAISTGSRIRLEATEGRIVIDNHSVMTVEKCEVASGFICLSDESGRFALAFPVEPISEKSKWEYKGLKFRVSRKINRKILGKRYSGFHIFSRQRGDNYWYFFSPEDGLLAFGMKGKSGLESTFILEGNCGFAAARKCT